MPAPLQVVEIGERCRYRVHSERHPRNLYLVDLLANGGLGECTCKHWSCRCWPLVKQGQVARCKHVSAARAHFLDQLLALMAVQEEPAVAPCKNAAVARTGNHGRDARP